MLKKLPLTFSFFLLAFSFALAQWHSPSDSSLWPTSPDSGLTIGYGDYPFIVSDEDGGAIIAFQAGSPQQIKVKRVDRYGWLQWNGWSGVIAGGIEDYQILSDVAEDGNGGILIAFWDVDEINLYEFYSYATVQRIDHNGNKLWGEGIRVATLDSIIQIDPLVASDGLGGCIVNFLDSRFSPYPYFVFDLFVQKIDSMGNICWGDSAIRVSDTTDVEENSGIMLLFNENKETLLRWTYYQNLDIYIQKLDESGNKLWGNKGILSDYLAGTRYISDNKGGFYSSGIIYINGFFRLSCNHVDSTGQKQWGNEGITLVDSVVYVNHESDVTGMLYDDSGNIIISYYFAHSGEQSNTYLQKLTPFGTKIFPEDGLLASNSILSERGGGMILYENSFLYPWNDSRGGTYVQKFDFNGNRLWNEDVYFSTRGIVPGQFTNDTFGGIIKVDQYLDFSIKLIKMSKNGTIGEVITGISYDKKTTIPEKLILYQNHPNPFNGTTTIKFWLAKPSHVQLIIYDVSGRLLQAHDLGLKVSSEHEISIDMNAYASGLYFYQLTAGKQTQVKKFLLIK